MALYEGLRPEKRPAPTAPVWRPLEARLGHRAPSGPFLDRLLGQGSTQTLGRAVGSALAATRGQGRTPALPAQPGRPGSGDYRVRRMRALGAGDGALPRGRKGLIRGLLLVAGLAWAAAMLKPWQMAGELHVDLAALFSRPPAERPRHQDPAQAAQAALDRRDQARARREAADAAHLAGLPLVPGGGAPRALWQGASGRWFKVDDEGLLSPGEAPGHRDSLGLVQLRGASAVSETHGQGRRLRLGLPKGLLKDLLPLQAGVASEAQALLLDDPREPVILTHDGARCLLDRAAWVRQQGRLALVLADLAARGRRAELIDLRYEDSAVVRPAGR